jgi:CRISPR-associated protein Cas1
VKYRGRTLKWDTVVERKADELGRFIVQKSFGVDFAEPSPNLVRRDDSELRSKILALTQSKARELGIAKSTLHYLRRNARKETFVVYGKVRKKLERHTEVIHP